MFEFVVRVCFLRCISVGERRTCLCITTSQVDLQCDHSVSRLPPSRTIASSPQGPRPNQKKKPDRDLDSRVKRASFFFCNKNHTLNTIQQCCRVSCAVKCFFFVVVFYSFVICVFFVFSRVMLYFVLAGRDRANCAIELYIYIVGGCD